MILTCLIGVLKIANAVQSNINNNNGGSVPDGLRKGIATMFSIDNVDCKVDTPDGKDSFHGLDFINAPATKLCNIPKLVLPLFPYQIMGSPKPQESPQYPNF